MLVLLLLVLPLLLELAFDPDRPDRLLALDFDLAPLRELELELEREVEDLPLDAVVSLDFVRVLVVGRDDDLVPEVVLVEPDSLAVAVLELPDRDFLDVDDVVVRLSPDLVLVLVLDFELLPVDELLDASFLPATRDRSLARSRARSLAFGSALPLVAAVLPAPLLPWLAV